MFRRAVPDALVVYGTKAFPNVAVMRLLAEEGLGADVASLGELAFARRAGIEGDRLIVHGNNKSDEELRAAADAGALVAIDALDEPARAAEAGVRRVLVRVTPGVETETHEAIRTGHRGSKFGLDADEALVAIAAARTAGLEVEGLHVHVGSQLADGRAHLEAVSELGEFATRCRDELDWTPALVDVGGGFGIRHVEEEPEPPVEELRALHRGRGRERMGDEGFAGAAPRLRARAARSSALPRSRSTASVPSSRRATRATSRSTAACPTTPGHSSTTPATPPCSQTGRRKSRQTATSRSPGSTASRVTS